jgi:LysM repeat protein
MKTFFLSFILLISVSLMGQQQKFIVQNSGSQLYLEHKVAPKENWYSVGRLYSISPKEIATFNKLSMDKGLGIGQMLKIPVKPENFSQSMANENIGGKVVHVVQPQEGLYKLANLYHIDKELLKKMNGLTSDQINAGTNLVIGYLLPSGESVVTTAPSSPAKTTPVTNNLLKNAEKESVVEEKAKKPAPETTAATPQPSAKSIQSPAPVKVVEEVVEAAKPVVSSPKSNNSQALKPEKSYFSTLFEQQSKEGKQQKLENSVYGVFKSTSGWQDGKYYVLMNNVVPGTVVKLVRRSTEKVVFAKVLGAVPPGKESEGLALRMSNAAVAALGLGDAGNDVDLVWFN